MGANARVPPERIAMLLNFVDLSRFRERPPIATKPRRALVLSNGMAEENGVAVIREACRSEGITVEVAGIAAGHVAAKREELLRDFDLVFAKSRAALEAMAVGCAVILCDAGGLGPYVRFENLTELRELNFGFRTLTSPIAPTELGERIRGYDAAGAKRVSSSIREHASLEDAVTQLEKIPEAAWTDSSRPARKTDRARSRITSGRSRIL